MEQRTDAWHQARLGKVTASRISDVMAMSKNGVAATRQNYEAQLIAERLSGQPTPLYSNAAMQWGTDQEPHARSAYSFIVDSDVEEIGFVDHPLIRMSGASPDGLIGSDGLIEIKCPNTATHLRFLEDEKIDKRYRYQMNWQMACTGRQWCDFVSYDPRLPDFDIKIVRVERDQELIKNIEAEVSLFQEQIDKRMQALLELNGVS